MKRFTSDDRNEQGHELMPTERDGDAAMLEPAVEGVASERTWSRRQVVGLAGATLAGVAGLTTFGAGKAEAAPIVAAGSSPKDGSGWQTYGNGALYIDVNTSAAQFSRTPVYVTSLGGDSRHWDLVGGGAVYVPTSRGFRVYVKHHKGSEEVPITRLDALDRNWHVKWHAILA